MTHWIIILEYTNLEVVCSSPSHVVVSHKLSRLMNRLIFYFTSLLSGKQKSRTTNASETLLTARRK